jgi:hypothetical protein
MAYIDPITGAYVADSLDALPPGYNQPKAGNQANVAQMRAQLNSDEALRQQQASAQAKNNYLSDPSGLAKFAMERMPGAPIAQTALGMASDMFGQVLGIPYGIYQGIKSGDYGKSTGNAQKEAQALADAMRYTPPTQAGRDIYEGVNRLPQVVTGSGMGTGPLPQLLNSNVRLSPDDLRVMGARGASAAREVGDIPRDFSAAQSGLTRLNAYDEPTYGARLQGVAEDLGDVMARRQTMRPEEGVPSMPGFGSFTDMVPDPRMYAVKPKGGNWPTNLGSTLPLKEQGALGKHLSEVQYDDPVAVFKNQLEKYFERGIDNRQLVRDWEDYLDGYISIHANGIEFSDLNGPAMQALKKEAADKFAENHNIAAADLDPTNKKLYTASQIEQTLPAYNAWVMGPYQKYITNQMGTGLATDPLLQAVNEGGMPLKEIFDLRRGPSDYLIEKGANRRRDFVKELTDYGNKPQVIENTPIGQITATTPEGLEYENVLDAQLYPKGPYAYKDSEGGTSEFPVVAKLNRDTLITDFLSSVDEETGFPNIRKQVFKDLLAGNIDPAKLSNITPATVTRQMIKDKIAEFKADQLSKKGAADWIPKRAAEMPTDMAFDDGSKMTIITSEIANADEAMTARDLGQITIDLNQCVGAGCHNTQDYPGHGPFLVPHTGKPPRGNIEYDKYSYLKQIKKGELEIASLKDPEGVSQATIDLRLEKPKKISSSQKEFAVGVWLEDNKTPEDVREFYNNKMQHGIDMATVMAVEKFPELQTRLDNYNGGSKKSIRQMRGKDNNEVPQAYVPHIVEWLNKNADQLTDVSDLDHLPNVHDLTRSYDAVGRLMDKNNHWYSPTVEQFFDQMEKENGIPRFFTTDDFALKATERGVDLSAEPPRKEGEQYKYPEGASNYQKDMIDYFEPGAIRKSYGGYDRIISYDPETGTVVASEVKLDENGRWIDHPTYGGPRSHFTMPSATEFQKDMGRPMRINEQSNVDNQLVNAVREMEPEAPQQFQPARVDPQTQEVLAMNMHDYFQNPEGDDHYANLDQNGLEDIRILMGNQAERSRLPIDMHQRIVAALLDQDNNTVALRQAMDGLQRRADYAGANLTEPQAENVLNIVISWTERYPLNE